MKATKPQFFPRRRWSSSLGHMTFTLAMGPKRKNSLLRICTQASCQVPAHGARTQPRFKTAICILASLQARLELTGLLG